MELLINNIIDNVLNYNPKEFNENYIKLIDELIKSVTTLDIKKREELNNYLIQLDMSYRSKDYILIYDILEYKIKLIYA